MLKSIITIWTGPLSTIPPGWHLCDGTGGTPNLLGLYLKQVPTSTTNPGSTGGAASHSHTNAHTHTYSHTHTTGGASDSVGHHRTASGCPSVNHTHGVNATDPGTSSVAVTIDSASNDPPFFEVAYIMKVV